MLHYYWLAGTIGSETFKANAAWCRMDNDCVRFDRLYVCSSTTELNAEHPGLLTHSSPHLYPCRLCACAHARACVCLPGNTAVGFLQSLHSDAPASQQRAYCAVLPWELICLTFFFPPWEERTECIIRMTMMNCAGWFFFLPHPCVSVCVWMDQWFGLACCQICVEWIHVSFDLPKGMLCHLSTACYIQRRRQARFHAALDTVTVDTHGSGWNYCILQLHYDKIMFVEHGAWCWPNKVLVI